MVFAFVQCEYTLVLRSMRDEIESKTRDSSHFNQFTTIYEVFKVAPARRVVMAAMGQIHA